MDKLQKKFKQQINSMVEISHRLAYLGYVASHGGNISLRVDHDIILITPTKIAKRKITFNDICIVSRDGKILFMPENRTPTGETPMHNRIYIKRPDINAVIHAHPPCLTGFAIAQSALLELPLLPEPVLELGPVLSINYEEPISEKLAQAVDTVITKSNAFLMNNHGAMILSYEDLERAIDLLEMAESMAQSVCTAKILGKVNVISCEEIINLNNVLRKRAMPLPGKKDQFHSLEEVFNIKSGN